MAHLRPKSGIALQVAEWHHIAMAAIVLLVLAMEVHLSAIDASGDVVGGGAFLLIMWLGLPAVYLGIAILYHSLKASDTRTRRNARQSMAGQAPGAAACSAAP